MVECKTLEEAQAVPNLIRIESGKKIIAYQVGDALPRHCQSDEEREDAAKE